MQYFSTHYQKPKLVMKKKTEWLFASLILATTAFSQTEVSLNISNLLINEANVTYEKSINDYFTIGAFASYVYDLPPTENNQFINRNFYFGPEVRYYVAPKNGFDRFFIGLYLKESIGTVSFNENYYYYYYDNSSPPENKSSAYSKLAFGINLGSKWVARNNIVYGLNFGIGRNLYSSFENEAMKEYYFNQSPAAENFDFRFGFTVGYRFKYAGY